MNKDRIFFVTGLLLLVIAMFAVTIMPPLFKKFLNITLNNYAIVEFEFIMLFLCGIFYCLSFKFYKHQSATLFVALFYYMTFVRFYRFIF